jgi:hypothetical protein
MTNIIEFDIDRGRDNSHLVGPIMQRNPHQWYLHLIVVVGFKSPRDPESYAGKVKR